MASTFQTESSASAELLTCILEGNPWPDYLLRRALIEDEGRQLFSVVIERLGDLFEPALCDEYARLFTRVVELLRPEWKASDLLSRYERVRRIRRCQHSDVRNVFVLSRVTLGADVAVTSVILDALQRRFPDAKIHLTGPRKNFELFAGNSRIAHAVYPYPRAGSLAERLEKWEQITAPDSIVVDPDSRLTQLGILPVCPEDEYFFFESRAFRANSDLALPQLTSEWCEEVFGESGRPWLCPVTTTATPVGVAASLGVGDNPAKRIPGSFEEDLLRSLVQRNLSVMVDEGGGGEETERVRELCKRIPGLQRFSGSFADFAGIIRQAKLYVGYDSAGQHVAAASGVPLVTVFAGFVSDRMFQRWKPWGPGPREIIKVTQESARAVLSDTIGAIDRILVQAGANA